MEDWENNERRAPSPDHDVIIRIDENVKNFIDRFNAHEIWNASQFKTLFTRTTALQKFQWFLAGGFVVINIVVVVGAAYLMKH